MVLLVLELPKLQIIQKENCFQLLDLVSLPLVSIDVPGKEALLTFSAVSMVQLTSQ